MLQIRDIHKQYTTGTLTQKALDGVSLAFRDSEFVAILGPSGSGKTTLLNIVGGLDRYDSGDLIIDGVSTKNYSDRDWDTYRNHAIGFVFQSYNLISHQSILANVELALTISGISRTERRQRAMEALEKVGLGDQLHKRPNQMSGGQMQRVAIARALVNDPKILLADEPTGALDSATGIQVMELLKEVAQDRLVIMVTHNPDLADQYATRIVRLQDGRILSDTDPFVVPDAPLRSPTRVKKASMSFKTALGLSFNNLLTKKGRTFMTAAAGSIGIIGIALILALSSGVDRYITDLQKSTMSSYPITISSTAIDMTAMIDTRNSMMGQVIGEMQDDTEPDPGIHASSDALLAVNRVVSNFVENDLTAFKTYLDNPDSPIRAHIGGNGIHYSYDTWFDVYVRDESGAALNTSRDLTEKKSTGSMFQLSGSASPLSGGMSSMDPTAMMNLMMGGHTEGGAANFTPMLPGPDGSLISSVVLDSYDLLAGSWPVNANEAVLILDRRNALSSTVMTQLGLMPEAEYRSIREAIDAGATEVAPFDLAYEDVLGKTYTLVTFSDYFAPDEAGHFIDRSSVMGGLEEVLEDGLELRIVGVVRANEDASIYLPAAIGYPAALTDWIIDHTNDSAVLKAQEASPDIDVLTGRAFAEADDAVKQEEAITYLSGLGVSDKAALYMMLLYTNPTLAQELMSAPSAMPGETPSDMMGMMPSDLSAMMGEMPPDFTASMAPAGTTPTDMAAMMDTMSSDKSAMSIAMPTDEVSLASMMDLYLAGNPDPDFLLSIYDTYLSGSSYEANLSAFGKVSREAPSVISIYCDTFEAKEAIADCIADYNATVSEDSRITYTDYVAMMTSAITNMVNIISYVLVAFVAVSLVVSCIMISIITQISVMERTREIGILRAIGASKGNISQVFNAETFIIGISSGLIGVGFSALLTIPINAIIHALTDSTLVNVHLPLNVAAVLVLISIVITVLSGLIPAKNAARKDPVVALRTE